MGSLNNNNFLAPDQLRLILKIFIATTVVDLAEKAKANGLKIQCLTFKDSKKRVSLEIAQQHFRLFERLQNKPFWIWNIDEQYQGRSQ